jgi:hypothetical protein
MNNRKNGVNKREEYPERNFSKNNGVFCVEHKKLSDHMAQLINHVSVLR